MLVALEEMVDLAVVDLVEVKPPLKMEPPLLGGGGGGHT